MSRVVVPLFHNAVGLLAGWRTSAAFMAYPSKISNFLLLPALLSLLLSACATEGDFGRPRPTIFDRFADELLASESTLLGSRGGSGVTDDEMAMREAGHRLASPLNPVPPASSIPHGTPYGGYGGGFGPHNPAGPLATIHHALETDHQVLTQFGQAARRVLVTDSRRMQAVHDQDPYLLVEDKRSARARMRENFEFIELVFEDFGRRLQAYHYAIEDIRANAPNEVVAEVQGLLHHLRDRTASLEYELTHYFGAAVARGDYQPPRFASRAPPGHGPQRSYGPYPEYGRDIGRQHERFPGALFK